MYASVATFIGRSIQNPAVMEPDWDTPPTSSYPQGTRDKQHGSQHRDFGLNHRVRPPPQTLRRPAHVRFSRESLIVQWQRGSAFAKLPQKTRLTKVSINDHSKLSKTEAVWQLYAVIKKC